MEQAEQAIEEVLGKLPDGWQQKQDELGRLYFFNKNTNEKQDRDPRTCSQEAAQGMITKASSSLKEHGGTVAQLALKIVLLSSNLMKELGDGGLGALKVTGIAVLEATKFFGVEAANFQDEVINRLDNLQADVTVIKAKIEDVQKMLMELKFAAGLKDISDTYYAYIYTSKSRNTWLEHFKFEFISFSKNLAAFSPENTREYLHKILTEQCDEDIQPFMDTVDYFAVTRAKYLRIIVDFHKYRCANKLEDEDHVKQSVVLEMENFYKDIKSLEETAVGLYEWFHPVCSLPQELQAVLKPGYVPKIIASQETYLGKIDVGTLYCTGTAEKAFYKTLSLGGAIFLGYRCKTYGEKRSRGQTKHLMIQMPHLKLSRTCLVKNSMMQDGPMIEEMEDGSVHYGAVKWHINGTWGNHKKWVLVADKARTDQDIYYKVYKGFGAQCFVEENKWRVDASESQWIYKMTTKKWHKL